MDKELGPEVRDWLRRVALPGHGITSVRPLTGGYRNPTTLVAADDGRRYVLRRYPDPHPFGNTCATEVALLQRLTGVVPVASTVAADPAGAVAGEPVLLTRFVAGTPVSSLLPELPVHEAAELGHAVGAALAALGTVTFSAPGFFAGPELVPGPPGMEPTAGLPEFVAQRLRLLEAAAGPDAPGAAAAAASSFQSADPAASGNPAGHVPVAVGPARAAGAALSAAERDALRELAARMAPCLDALRGARRLVHADYNPKNLLAARTAAGWTVTAVLDWEFAFSSSPLIDVGNMLRFDADLPPAYSRGFVDGFAAAGGQLPANWRELSRALDLFSLVDLLTRPAGNPVASQVVALLRSRLAAG